MHLQTLKQQEELAVPLHTYTYVKIGHWARPDCNYSFIGGIARSVILSSHRSCSQGVPYFKVSLELPVLVLQI